MRITQRAVATTSLQGLNRNLAAVGKLQQQLTSGRAIVRPSDSPTETNRAMMTRSDQAATEQHARNISDGKSWLDQSDSALNTMLSMSNRVRDLTVQGLNTGAMGPAAQAALATEITSLRDGLLAQANQQVQGRPIFGGTTGGPLAYDATGAWVGQAGGPVTRRISDSEVVRVDITGPESFGPPGADLFAVIASIGTDVTANPAALTGHLAALDGILDTMRTAAATVGSRASRVDSADQIAADRMLSLSSALADVEGIDLPKVIMELEMQKVSYEASLAATAKAIQPSLLDFLR